VASIVATLTTSVCRGASIVEVSPLAIHQSEPTEIDVHLRSEAVAWIGANPQIVAPVDLTTESITLPTHDKPVWKVRVRPKTPLSAGLLAVRIRSDRAVTDPWLLAVDSLPTVTLPVENSTAGVHRKITIPCGTDGTIQLWNIADGKRAKLVVEVEGEVYALARLGDQVFAATSAPSVLQIQAEESTAVADLPLSDWGISLAVHEPTGRWAAGQHRSKVKIRTLATSDKPLTFLAAP